MWILAEPPWHIDAVGGGHIITARSGYRGRSFFPRQLYVREDGALTEYALERHVTIATPTTLMMALRTVSHVWAVERRNRNAEEIAKRAGLLHDKVAGFVSNMEGVGTRLRQAQDSYDAALGQLSQGSGNLLRQAEMLKTLGARTTKSIGMEFDGTDEASAPQSGEVVMLEKAQEGVFAT